MLSEYGIHVLYRTVIYVAHTELTINFVNYPGSGQGNIYHKEYFTTFYITLESGI